MRCYHFGNFYLSSIQQGIQSAHAQMELFLKYPPINLTNYIEQSHDDEVPTELVARAQKSDMLYDWGRNHKTMICLNGGMAENLLDLADFMEQDGNPFPWSEFYEEEAALNSTITNVAIILPERIYGEAMSAHRKGEMWYCNQHESWIYRDEDLNVYPISDWEHELIYRLSQCRLAA